MQMRSGIYFILNKISLKLYIGSAAYLVRRKSEHFSRLSKNIHHNEHLQRAYNFYGAEAFNFIIIELAPLDKLIELEKFYIAKHRTTEEEFGYNKCEAGSGMHGRKHSPETIEKMRKAKIGQVISEKQKIKISNTLKAKNLKMSAEHKEKLRIANKKRKYKQVSEETRALMSKNRKGKKWTENRRNAAKNSQFVIIAPPINCLT